MTAINHEIVKTYPLSSIALHRLRRQHLSNALRRPWDRVSVLGDDAGYGHSGCVNALSWSENGEFLFSGGDDRTVNIWKIDPTNTTEQFPYIIHTTIATGHRANIFNAQMLPNTSKIVTAAGDREIHVSDIAETLSKPLCDKGHEKLFYPVVTVLSCHEDRVKRIVTEDSPHLFLSLSEDGSVRQHDIRISHNCQRAQCPPPLLEVDHELSTLSMSPLTPHYLVVAGLSPYGYLFDRRMTRPRSGWETNGMTTCVQRFGRRGHTRKRGGFFSREHITGSRVSKDNGHEVLLSYSGDGVYRYSMNDEAEEQEESTTSKATSKRARLDSGGDVAIDSEEEEEEDDEYDNENESFHSRVPVVLPRSRYGGSRNINTVKDVNFIGPFDELITSGSDDGNFFVWDKATAKIVGIYEADSGVVNVIEAHPFFPLVAVSGIDTTVKLFAPNGNEDQDSSVYSHLAQEKEIVKENEKKPDKRMVSASDLATLLARASPEGQMELSNCNNQ